mgnify:CR=1 FL=1|jgi:hypothetical protein
MQTHMLVVSAITFDGQGAVALAERQGIDAPYIETHDTFVFIARPKREFAERSLTRVNGQGYYALKGKLL